MDKSVASFDRLWTEPTWVFVSSPSSRWTLYSLSMYVSSFVREACSSAGTPQSVLQFDCSQLPPSAVASPPTANCTRVEGADTVGMYCFEHC